MRDGVVAIGGGMTSLRSRSSNCSSINRMFISSNSKPIKNLIFVIAIFATILVAASKKTVLSLERVSLKEDEVTTHDRRRHASMGILNFPVVGTFHDLPKIVGLYYTTIRLGSPPQEFHVQIDTGSPELWVNCHPCQNCPSKSEYGFQPNLYNPAASSSASPLSCSDSLCIQPGQCENSNVCPFSTELEDGSGAAGYFVSDLWHFDVVKNTSARIIFGCSTYLMGILTKENRAVDGILGLSYAYPATIPQLADQGIIPAMFSHCLGRDGRGELILGETKEPAEFVYSPMVPSMDLYYLYLEHININEKILPVNPNSYNASSGVKTVLDSGTSDVYFVPEVYDALINVIHSKVSQYAKHFISNDGSHCYTRLIRQIDIFPKVSFNFSGNTSIVLMPLDYLINSQSIIDGVPLPTICVGFRKIQDAKFIILGDMVMKDKLFIYDIIGRRVGWKNYNCSMGVHVTTSSEIAKPFAIIIVLSFIMMMCLLGIIYLGIFRHRLLI